MNKKIVIVGSVSLQSEIKKWINYFKDKGLDVIDYPKPIEADVFLDEYPKVYTNFFKNLIKADTVFLMNEDKKGISGYVGAESYAEICFVVSNNLTLGKNTEVFILQKPSTEVQSFEELNLWLKLGWIKLFQENLL